MRKNGKTAQCLIKDAYKQKNQFVNKGYVTRILVRAENYPNSPLNVISPNYTVKHLPGCFRDLSILAVVKDNVAKLNIK